MISWDTKPKVAPTASPVSKGGDGGINWTSQYVAPTPIEQINPITEYAKRVVGQYQQIGSGLVSDIQKQAEIIRTGTPLEAGNAAIRAGLRSTGAVARGAFAPIMEIPIVKQATEKIVQGVTKIPGAENLIKSTADFATKHPEVAKDVGNIVDILSLGIGGAVERPLIQEVKAIGTDISNATKVILTPSEEAIQSKVISLFEKSIKPTAKKTLAQSERYNADTLNALRTIKANADKLNIEDATGELISGRTPQSINELAQGLDQTKKIVFTQYDDLAKKAGTAGATIDAKPIADEVAKVAQNKALQLTNPTIITYAKGWEERLRGFDVLDAETTQEVIKLMNTNLQAFYRNPTYDAASKVTIDAGIANNFRVALDKAIETATGEQYQILKRQYGALKAIENDVVRASMRDARKNTKGLLDYTDIFTGGQMVGGILSLNPAMFTKGAIERGFKEYIKFLNDPNRAVGNIFEKLEIDTTKVFEPVSMTGKALKNPSLGMTIQDVTKGSTSGNQSKGVSGILQTESQTSPKPTIPAGISKADIPLAREAQKYSSAEEFVKAQGEPLYHGTGSDTNINLENGKTLFLTDSKYAAGTYGENIKEYYVPKGLKTLDLSTEKGRANYPFLKKIAEEEIGKTRITEYKRLLDDLRNKSGKYTDTVEQIQRIVGNPDSRFYLLKEQQSKYTDARYWLDQAENPKGKVLYNNWNKIIEQAKKDGYEAIKASDTTANAKGGVDSTAIFDQSKLQTKSQLTDFYNKVKGIKK